MVKEKIKILAIDDIPDNLVVLKALINDLFPAAVFISADSGKTGFELCQSEKPDVILLDVAMPGMDGYELCAKLKSNPRLKSIPVIMVTANRADKASRVKALEAGADAFLPKPVDESELKAQIRAMLRIKESEDKKKEEKQRLEDMVLDRTEALENELADRQKAENRLILSLDKITRNRQAIMNLMEDLKVEINERKHIEANLKSERNLLRTLIDNLPDTIYVFDKECRKIIANKADVDIIGCQTEAEVLGKTDLEMYPGESGKRFYSESMTVINTGIPKIDYEEKFTDKEGQIRFLNTSQIPLYDSGGNIMGLVGIGHDVTNRKKAEEVIILKNNELQFLYKMSTDLAAMKTEENMSVFLLKKLKEYSGSGFLIYSEFDDEQEILITRHIETDKKNLNRLIKIAGDKILNNPAPIRMTKENLSEILTDIVAEKRTLNEVSFGAIPEFVDKAFNAFTGNDRYFAISFVVAGELFGTALIGLNKNQTSPSIDLLKSFAQIAAVSLQRRKTEEKLRKSEKQYRLVIENQGEGVGVVDLDEKFVFANPSAEEMFGVEKGGLIDRSLLDFVAEDHKAKIKKETKKRSKAEKSSYEIEIIRQNGERRTILITATPHLSNEGKLTGTFGVFRDITERKHAELEVLKKQEFIETILENSPIGFAVNRMDDGSVVYVGRKFEEIYGVERGSLKSVSQFFEQVYLEPVYRERIRERITADISSNDLLRMKWDDIELTARTGEHKFISATNIPLYDQNIMISTVQDITERKKLEKKIIESEAYYRTLIDISPDGILISDLEGNISYGSIKALEIFGVPPGAKVTGTSIFNWLSPDDQEAIMERVVEIMKGNVAPETREFKLRRFDGTIFWGELSSSPLSDSTRSPSALMIVCRDISDRKKAELELIRSKEKAEESDRLKTAFLHNISHEIRTPMNAIIGFSAMLGEPELDKVSQNSYIDIITQSSNHLLAIVSDIIEISNIEAGILKLNLKSTNLNSVISSLHKLFLHKTTEKNIAFGLITALPDSGSDIITDEIKLTQVLSCLLSNACKFTEEGTIELGYRLKEDNIEFFVSDTGIGIREDQFDRIFDRFYQVENSITRLYEGTGLGLAISKAYIELMGGKIWLTSKPGTGSVFIFSLPYLISDSPIRGEKNLPEKSKIKIYKKKTILIAEDEENNFRLMAELLSKLDLTLIHALNGKEAVNICESDTDIDMVIMDIKMPVMDGYEATGIIKKSRPSLPVIAQTAYAFESDREKAIMAGCDDYIAKPLKKDILIELIKKYL